jgi:hypothetical protein
MLPDADNFPSLPAELAVDAPVAGHVGVSLSVPEGSVGFWPRVTLGTAVPETSVDEDGNLLRGERKVRLSGQGKMSPPTGDSTLPEQRPKPLLGQLIALCSNKGHHLRPF